MLLTTFIVTKNYDDGAGDIASTLSWAILQANDDPISNGPDAIGFEIPMIPNRFTIHVDHEPALTRDEVTINVPDISQPIVLEGSGGVGDPSEAMLTLDGNVDSVIGMTITQCSDSGIILNAADYLYSDVVTDNGCAGVVMGGDHEILSADVITSNGADGVDVTGSYNTIGTSGVALAIGPDFGGNQITGNAGSGVSMFGQPQTTQDTLLEGNLISGNGNDGVQVDQAGSGNALWNNFIGTDITGTVAVPNGWTGVSIYNSPDNLIGGTIQGASNVISANGNNGIWIAGSASTNEVIQGNKVGTDFSGRYALGNAWSDISVTNDGGNPTNVLIGGAVPQAQNVIASAGNAGVWVTGPGVTGVVVQGNHIGNDITGEVALGNAWGGVIIGQGASSETLADNLISGNSSADGVTITDPGTSDNLVVGNWIGIDESGTQPLGNGHGGVNVTNGATNNTVGGTTLAALNVISSNGWDGVGLGVGTSGNVVQGNFIGTNDSGTAPLGNGNRGIGIYNSSGNLIGGSAPGAGNTIADNLWEGVAIIGSSDNLVEGNRIGTDDSGLRALGNHTNGVGIWSGSTGNTIGGSVAGNGNLISGNGGGIAISDPGTSGNVVQGNLIGTDATGRTPLGNVASGVAVNHGATENTIGGPLAGEGNVLAANGGDGVGLGDPGTSGNVVQGNLIGTDRSGTSPLGNGNRGVGIYAGASGNLVGGTAPGDGNTIADNGWEGVAIIGASASVVEGNRIGTDVSGLKAIGNHLDGVGIWGGSTDNTIGGPAAGAGNLISGNATNYGAGVGISDAGTSGNLVQGNLIGTDATGRAPLGNTYDGVDISNGASNNTIGGAVPGDENVISSNLGTGVSMSGAGTTGNVVARNFIGTDLTGTSALGNLQGGVAIFNGASGNLIGTTDEGGGNFISANGFDGSGGSYSGVAISGDGTDGNIVQHNFIGLAAGGESALPNAQDGVDVFGGADGNTIGGSVHHTENLISGNVAAGVVVSDFATNRNVIQGDLIGTDLTGNLAIPNGSDGVQLVNTHSNTVGGGTTVDSRNIIAGNVGSGVDLINAAANTVAGNAIGVGLGGSALGNLGFGLYLQQASSFNIIGGTTPSSVNLICANGLAGLSIDGTNSEANVVQGNLIGTDGNGAAGMGNAYMGVLVTDGASNNTIGGTSATARNVISGNGFLSGVSDPGVEFYGSGTTGNLLEGNFIGTDATGTVAVGNFSSGVAVEAGADDNTIGGTGPGAGNLISGNGNPAAVVAGTGFGSGVDIYGIDEGVSGTFVAGNLIGTDVTGTKPLGNLLDGVHLQEEASNNTVGGTTTGSGNVIAFNGGNGVTVGETVTDDCTGDAILENAIFGNMKLGIDLANNGVTLNDSSGHTGPNLFQDFPVLTSALTTSGETAIAGTLTGSPDSTYRLEFFRNSAADPSGYGQGQTFLTFANVTTDSTGTATFSIPTPGAVTPGQFITGTATDPGGDTSEFSAHLAVFGVTTTIVSSANPAVFGQTVTLTATVSTKAPGAGTPTGDVTFMDGSTDLGTVSLSAGSATLTTSGLAVGNHPIVAVYDDDLDFLGSTSRVINQRVNPDGTTTGLVSSANPSVYGHTLVFNATVTADAPGAGMPSGDVTFYDGATVLGTVPLVSGTASFSTSSLPVGTDRIRAVYAGNLDFKTSLAVLSQVVRKASSVSVTVAPAATIDQAIAVLVDMPPDASLIHDLAMGTVSTSRRQHRGGTRR
jgi:hypothetical protein